MFGARVLLTLPVVLLCQAAMADSSLDQQFEELGQRYIDQYAATSPLAATWLGDHRCDGELDEVSPAARDQDAAFCRKFLDALAAIDASKLSRANQVDHALLKHRVRVGLWRLETLEEWAWNPLQYTGSTGGAVYGLMAREFAPLDTRLGHVADRLEQFPRFLEQVRATLDPERVPKVHAETAVMPDVSAAD